MNRNCIKVVACCSVLLDTSCFGEWSIVIPLYLMVHCGENDGTHMSPCKAIILC
jgi:hypothetical protein